MEVAVIVGDQPNLAMASTRELLVEVAVRMEKTQNSNNGRELASMCRAACDNLARGVLDYRPVGGW